MGQRSRAGCREGVYGHLKQKRPIKTHVHGHVTMRNFAFSAAPSTTVSVPLSSVSCPWCEIYSIHYHSRRFESRDKFEGWAEEAVGLNKHALTERRRTALSFEIDGRRPMRMRIGQGASENIYRWANLIRSPPRCRAMCWCNKKFMQCRGQNTERLTKWERSFFLHRWGSTPS